MTYNFKVYPGQDKCRLDKFLVRQLPEFSRSQLSLFVKEELVKVNGKVKKSSYLLQAGETVNIKIPALIKDLKPYNFPVPVLWEDEYLLVVNKPQGLVVHPHGKNKDKTLVNVFAGSGRNFSCLNKERPGVVHRLDKETSGVMVLAKNSLAEKNVIRQFKERLVFKEYRALVWGRPKESCFEINLPLGRKEKNRLQMEVKLAKAKNALTKIKTLKQSAKMAYLAVFPKTGRMHQIRVHLNFFDLPIVGDKKYGKKDNYQNLFLHAYKIKLKHPLGGESLQFFAPLPKHFQVLLKSF